MELGIASGWAATGVHQSVKQLTKQEQLRQYAGGCARIGMLLHVRMCVMIGPSNGFGEVTNARGRIQSLLFRRCRLRSGASSVFALMWISRSTRFLPSLARSRQRPSGSGRAGGTHMRARRTRDTGRSRLTRPTRLMVTLSSGRYILLSQNTSGRCIRFWSGFSRARCS